MQSNVKIELGFDFKVEETLNRDLYLGIVFSLVPLADFREPVVVSDAFTLHFGRPCKFHGLILTTFGNILDASGKQNTDSNPSD